MFVDLYFLREILRPGGLIVLDFIDMRRQNDQRAVYQRMKEGLRRDKAKTHVLPISQLGLMEMTRQRHSESAKLKPAHHSLTPRYGGSSFSSEAAQMEGVVSISSQRLCSQASAQA